MFNPTKQITKVSLPLVKPAAMMVALLALAGCGGGGSDNAAPTPTTATFGLQISDAPIDDAAAVVVCF